jgi:Zn-finger nucleic acid-binding protein
MDNATMCPNCIGVSKTLEEIFDPVNQEANQQYAEFSKVERNSDDVRADDQYARFLHD